MKVFISWSGPISHNVAICFRDWLPNVIQSVVPYVSSEDIDKGTRWSNDIAEELSDSFYGILCVTKDNLHAPWLNFEAGALSKSIENSNVSPFLFDLTRPEVSGPILQFQSTVFEKSDIRKLVGGINKASTEQQLQEARLDQIFDVWWPRLETALKEISDGVKKKGPENDQSHSSENSTKMIEEILELSRNQNRLLATQERQMYEAVSRALSASDQSPFIDKEHPVFRDLERSWGNLTSMVELTNLSEVDAELLRSAMSEFNKPLLFLLSRTDDRASSRLGGPRRPLSSASLLRRMAESKKSE